MRFFLPFLLVASLFATDGVAQIHRELEQGGLPPSDASGAVPTPAVDDPPAGAPVLVPTEVDAVPTPPTAAAPTPAVDDPPTAAPVLVPTEVDAVPTPPTAAVAPTAAAPTAAAPTPAAPTPAAPTPAAPTPAAPTPAAPTPAAPTPEAPTPAAPTPEVPTPAAPTPEAPTPAAPIPSPTPPPIEAPVPVPTVPTDFPTKTPYIPTDGDPLTPTDGGWPFHDPTLEELEHDRTALIALSVVGGIGLCCALFTAQQMLENPDGCCASICRILVACSCAITRCLCFPCRYVCGCTNNKERRGHDLVMQEHGNYTHDLELS